MSLFRVSKLLMTIDSRDSASIVSILCKKVNEWFVDRNANVVSLNRENQAWFHLVQNATPQ